MTEKPLKVVTIRTIILAAIIAIGIYVILGNSGIDYVLSFLYGVLVILVNFFMIAYSVTRIVEMDDPVLAKKAGTKHYVARAVVFAGMFVLGIVVFKLNIIMMFLGTVIVKLVIHLDNFFASIKRMKMW